MAPKSAVVVKEETLKKITDMFGPGTRLKDVSDIGLGEGEEDSRPVIERQDENSGTEKKG